LSFQQQKGSLEDVAKLQPLNPSEDSTSAMSQSTLSLLNLHEKPHHNFPILFSSFFRNRKAQVKLSPSFYFQKCLKLGELFGHVGGGAALRLLSTGWMFEQKHTHSKNENQKCDSFRATL